MQNSERYGGTDRGEAAIARGGVETRWPVENLKTPQTVLPSAAFSLAVPFLFFFFAVGNAETSCSPVQSQEVRGSNNMERADKSSGSNDPEASGTRERRIYNPAGPGHSGNAKRDHPSGDEF